MTASSQPGRRRKPRGRGRTIVLSILVVLVCVGLGAAGAAVFTALQKPLYAATAVVRVYDPTVVAQTSNNARVDPTRQTAIEVSFAQSDAVTTDAKKTLRSQNVNYDHVTWNDLVDQDAISVTCYAGKASNTVACASQFAAVFIDHRKLDVPKTLGPSLAAITSQINSIKNQIANLQTEISKTNAVSQAAKLKGLVTQQQQLGSQQSLLVQQANNLRAQIAGTEATYQVVSPASLPDSKVSPTITRNYGVGLIGGLVVGLAILLMVQQVSATRRMGQTRTEYVDGGPRFRSAESVNGSHPQSAFDGEVDESANTEP